MRGRDLTARSPEAVGGGPAAPSMGWAGDSMMLWETAGDTRIRGERGRKRGAGSAAVGVAALGSTVWPENWVALLQMPSYPFRPLGFFTYPALLRVDPCVLRQQRWCK